MLKLFFFEKVVAKWLSKSPKSERYKTDKLAKQEQITVEHNRPSHKKHHWHKQPVQYSSQYYQQVRGFSPGTQIAPWIEEKFAAISSTVYGNFSFHPLLHMATLHLINKHSKAKSNDWLWKMIPFLNFQRLQATAKKVVAPSFLLILFFHGRANHPS